MKKMMEIMSNSMKHRSDGKFTKIETFIYDKKRNLIPIEIYAKMLFDENGDFCGLQGTTEKEPMLVIHKNESSTLTKNVLCLLLVHYYIS